MATSDSQTSARAAGFPHQPALDGLRGLAVIAVMAYHADLRWARGGYLGVDAFFVLSGYLITGLLLAEHAATGRIDLAAFWSRRARRLLPALAVLLGGVIAWTAVGAPWATGSLRQDTAGVVGYFANWRFAWSGEGYFDQFAAPSPLRHAWSLAIEEQFYLLWPLAVAAVLGAARRLRHHGDGSARRRGRFPAWLPAALGVASASAMLAITAPGTSAGTTRAYYGTDTRAQSLLVGAALAAALHERRPERGRKGVLAAGIAASVALGWAWARVDGATPALYRGGFLAVALGVVAVVAATRVPGRNPLRVALSWRPLRAVGRVSYGLYLWHWPVFLALTPGTIGLDGGALLAARVALTAAVAWSSFVAIEQPVRRGALAGWRTRVLIPATAGGLAVAVVAVTGGPVERVVTGASVTSSARMGTAGIALKDREAVPVDARSASPAQAATRVMFTGDSVALTLAAGFEHGRADDAIQTLNAGGMGCPLLRDFDAWVVGGREDAEAPREECDWPRIWPTLLDRFDPEVVVVLFGPWDAHDRRVGGVWLRVGAPQWRVHLEQRLVEAIDILSSRGAKVLVATSPYFRHADWPGVPDDESDEEWRIDELNDVYRAAVAARPARAETYDLNGLVSPGGKYAREVDGVVVRDDGVHISEVGARWVLDRMASDLKRAANAATSG